MENAKYTRVLVPLDGSPLSEEVIPLARLVAKGLGIRVHLLRAFGPIADTLPDALRADIEVSDIVGVASAHAQQYLENEVAILAEDGVTATWGVVEGPAAEVIIREANETGGTLIAMSTRGRSGLPRLFLGSVAERVVHASGSPVLLLPQGS